MNWGDSEQGPSTSVQRMIGEEIAKTKSTITGSGMKSWLIAVIAVVAIIFFVKKVS